MNRTDQNDDPLARLNALRNGGAFRPEEWSEQLAVLRATLAECLRLATAADPDSHLSEFLGNSLHAVGDICHEPVAEVRRLDGLPPLHEVDSALHKRRGKILRKYAPGGVLSEEGAYHHHSEDGERYIWVGAGDLWICGLSDGKAAVPGRGLASLIAYLLGEPLSATVARVAPHLGLSADA